MGQDLPLTETLFYMLLVLHHPLHGYGISKEVEQMTHGRVVLGAGTLYGAIKNLQKKDWIRVYREEPDSRNKKEYIITDLGKEVFDQEIHRLEGMLRDAKENKE
ncbi:MULTISPECIES: PadR family transcriptional regulator [Allobaculum]|uniref:PadR family transcriptional regulator n=1 Tax=Allobaculum TaxID=174708 RepID=UPI001E3FBE30|nr:MULTISPECIES: PadR family transcriptional regulator [Allobaculum]UNT93659.1 PadR family transcriptional regulator [Allobaculum sp. Allo2]